MKRRYKSASGSSGPNGWFYCGEGFYLEFESIVSSRNGECVEENTERGQNICAWWVWPKDLTTSKSDGTYVLGLNPKAIPWVQKAGYTTDKKQLPWVLVRTLAAYRSENFVTYRSITDSEGNALDQVLVNASKSGGGGATAVSDAEGAYSFDGLVGGSYVIGYSKTGCQ